MNPLRVTATNYRSFETLDLELPTGCVAVTGENGAGKSSIVNSVDLCLFGARSLSEFLSDSAIEEEMVIGLEFEHRGETYRIRRTYSGRGRGKASLDFEVEGEPWHVIPDEHTGEPIQVESPPQWEPLTRESAATTQELIEQTIGLSRETFRASAFLAQGDGAAFTEAQPRERKAILSEVLGLGIWDDLLAKARAEITGIRDKTTRLVIQVEEAERDLEAKGDTVSRVGLYERDLADAEVALANAETIHGEATDALNASRELAAKLEAAREVLASRERELQSLTTRRRQVTLALEGAEDLPKLKAESEALAARTPYIEAELAVAQEAEAARAEHQRLTTERDRLLDAANELAQKEAAVRVKIERLEGIEPTECDRCGQPLEAGARERALASLGKEGDGYYDQKLKLQGEAKLLLPALELTAEADAIGPTAARQAELNAALVVAIEAGRTLASIDERMKRVDELIAESAELDFKEGPAEQATAHAFFEVENLKQKIGDTDHDAAVARAAGRLYEARSQAETARRHLAVAEAELKRLEGIEALAAENRHALERFQSELDLLLLAERAYGRDGIPALIIENAAIPQIESEADRILAELGTDFRVELRTQRELKSRDGVAEALDIIVAGPAGERPYESFSGGERTRLNLALRIALARLLAHRRGAEVRMLAIDEPDGLDAAGFAALSSILQGMTGDFERIMVISHHPDLQTAFDQTLVVEKQDGRSRVVGAGVAEAVPA